MNSNCIFCNFNPHKKVYEDDKVLAFYDKYPKYENHILIIPKKHVKDLASADINLISRLFEVLLMITKKNNMQQFKVNINNGSQCGQEIFHLHIHLMSGRRCSVSRA